MRCSLAIPAAPICPIRRRPAKTLGILYDAVHSKIAPLGGEALLYPAHGRA
jgi:hypothetical protein